MFAERGYITPQKDKLELRVLFIWRSSRKRFAHGLQAFVKWRYQGYVARESFRRIFFNDSEQLKAQAPFSIGCFPAIKLFRSFDYQVALSAVNKKVRRNDKPLFLAQSTSLSSKFSAKKGQGVLLPPKCGGDVYAKRVDIDGLPRTYRRQRPKQNM